MDSAAMITLAGLVLMLFVLALIPFAGPWHPSTGFLFAHLAITALIMLSSWLVQMRFGWIFTGYFTLPLAFLHGPAVYLYTRTSLYDLDWRAEIRGIRLAGVPFFLILCLHNYLSWRYNWMGDPEVTGSATSTAGRYIIFMACVASIYNLVWYGSGFPLIRKYARQFEELFSTESDRQIRWLGFFLVLHILWFILPLLIGGTSLLFPTAFEFTTTIVPVIPAIIVLYAIMQYILRQPRRLSPEEAGVSEQTPPETRYARSGLGANLRAEYANRLEESMQQDRYYLDPELTLPGLARELEMSVHHLSMVINTEFETNFHGMVSSFRAREAAALLGDPDLDGETILNIGFRAGFNSKAALNRAFKQYHGCTPREFRSRQKSNRASGVNGS